MLGHCPHGGGRRVGPWDQGPGTGSNGGCGVARGRADASRPTRGGSQLRAGPAGAGVGAGCGGHSPAGSSRCQVPRSPGKPARACALLVARGAMEGPWGRAAGCGLADQAPLLPDGQWPEGRAAAGRQLCAVAGAVWGLVEHLDERQGRAWACGSGVRGRRGARAGHSRPSCGSGESARQRPAGHQRPRKSAQQVALLSPAPHGPSLGVPLCPPVVLGAEVSSADRREPSERRHWGQAREAGRDRERPPGIRSGAE